MTKAGKEAKKYTIEDMTSLLLDVEEYILSLKMPDLDDRLKIMNFKDIMGYFGYVSGKEEDRPKLYVTKIYPLLRKKDSVQFGYSVVAKSVGSGKETRYTVFNSVYEEEPINEGDLIICKGYRKEGQYFKLTAYEKTF